MHTALKVAERLDGGAGTVGVIDLFDLSGFDGDALQAALAPYAGVVTMEEGFRGRGGLDSMMFDFMARRGLRARMLNIGVQGDYRFELGTRHELHEQVGIGFEAAHRDIERFLQSLAS
jgi:transketolase